MKGLVLIKHAAVLLLTLSGAIFIALGLTTSDPLIFVLMFLWLGLGLVLIAVRLNRLGEEFEAVVGSLFQQRRLEMAVTILFGGVAILTRNTSLGWLFLWPLWGSQPLVYIASAFVERAFPLDLTVVFRALAMSFEIVYLYFISSNGIVLIRTVFSRSNKPL